MQEKEIIKRWKQGLSKEKLAKTYKREYNMQIKIIRSEPRHRHSGRFITNFESLAHIEKIIYEYLKKER